MNDDDASLTAFLEREAAKPPVAPYRAYVAVVLSVTAAALEEGWAVPQLQAELDYAYAICKTRWHRLTRLRFAPSSTR